MHWSKKAYWNRIWKSIVGESAEFLIEAPGRSLALQGINEEMIQNLKGKSSLGLDDGGGEYTMFEQLEVSIFKPCIITPAPLDLVYKYTSGVNNCKPLTEPVPLTLCQIITAWLSVMTQGKSVAKVMKGNITVELTCPLLYSMEWVMNVRLHSTRPTPSTMGLTGKASDISISLETNLTLLRCKCIF